jgi:hypothetical protein
MPEDGNEQLAAALTDELKKLRQRGLSAIDVAGHNQDMPGIPHLSRLALEHATRLGSVPPDRRSRMVRFMKDALAAFKEIPEYASDAELAYSLFFTERGTLEQPGILLDKAREARGKQSETTFRVTIQNPAMATLGSFLARWPSLGQEPQRDAASPNTVGHRPLWRRRYVLPMLVASVLAVTAVTVYVTNDHATAKRNDSRTRSEVAPLRVIGVTPLQHVDPQEYLYATPAKVTIPDVRNFNRDVLAKPDYLDTWLTQHHAAVANIGYSNIVLTNTAAEEVQIIGVKVKSQCQAPLDGTVIYNPTTHGEGSGVIWTVDLDRPSPVVMTNVSFQGDGGVPEGTDYFAKHVITFKPGEQVTIQLSAMSKLHYCRVRFDLVLATVHGQKTETIDNHGQPFEVTGLAAKYQSAYSRGPDAKDQWQAMSPSEAAHELG